MAVWSPKEGKGTATGGRTRSNADAPPHVSALPGVLLALQRSAGNRAVTDLLRAGAPVQRDVENATYGGTDEDGKVVAKSFFDAINSAAQEAYKYVVAVPSLGAYAGLNGYTQHWHSLWTSYTSGGRPKLMAAAFGYVIESLVSDPRSPIHPAAPSGYSVVPQVTYGGTRPDLVLRLKKGTTDLAWCDLTASQSVDHIYDKEGWETKVGIFAEVTYPSLEPGTLALMVQNKDNTGPMSEAEFEEKMKVAREVYAKRKAHWIALGEQFQYSRLRRKVGSTLEMQRLQPAIPRAWIANALKEHFGSETVPNEKMVPSILAAMGVNPSSWGYTTGFNTSERAGEAWLVDNDPSL